MDFASMIILLIAGLVVAWCLLTVAGEVYEEWRKRRRARIEAELNAKAEQLRRTILSLADELAADREEASKALTRAMFITGGRTPSARP